MVKRNYGIDLLRILSMYMVLILHVLGQGGILGATEKFSAHYWTAWFLEISVYCAVNCFALISGFVMCNSKPKVSKLAELWLQTAVYTVSFTVLFFFLVPETRGWFALLDAVMPITRKHYWYISAYFGLYLLVPLLNAAIAKIEKRTFGISLLAMFVLFSVLPTMLRSEPYKIDKGYSLIWLCLLYLAGAYMNKYRIPEKIKKRWAWLVFFASVVLTFLSKVAIEYLTREWLGKPMFGDTFVDYVSPTIVLAALSLFVACSKLTFPPAINKIIAWFAPAALGVYLIHVCIPVWKNVIKNFSVSFVEHSVPVMVLVVLGSALGLYLLCSLIERLRIQIFQWLRIRVLCLKIEEWVHRGLAKLFPIK